MNDNINRDLENVFNSKNSHIDAIKQLKALYLSDQRKRFPNVPDMAIVAPEYSENKTNGLTKCIVDYINLSGYFVERTGNEGRIIDNRKEVTDCIGRTKTIGSIKRVRSSGTTGTSDLKAIIKGRFVAIEIKCKATGDRIRPDQLRYKLQVEKSGGLYYIATDLTSFVNWFSQMFGGAK